MKRSSLVVLLLSILLSSCQNETVELSQDYLLQGNWEQYIVTEQHFNNSDVPTITRKVLSQPIKITREHMALNNHSDSYSLVKSEVSTTIYRSCSESGNTVIKIEGLNNKYPDWMSWTIEENNAAALAAGSNALPSRVVKTIELRRIKVVK